MLKLSGRYIRGTNFDDQLLKKLYQDEHLSGVQIGKRLGLSPSTIQRHLRRCGIKLKLKIDDNKVRELYEQGLPAWKVGRQLGCSDHTVCDHLRKMGVPIRKSFHLDNREIAELYENGLSVEAIARKFGCSKSPIKSRLQETGYSIRKSNYREIPVDLDAIRQLYVDKKLSTTEIAKKVNVCPATVASWLRSLGCIRTRKEAQEVAFSTGRRKLSRNYVEKGKFIDKSGYVYTKQSSHYRANPNGYVPEHIVVWETYHNRKLPTGWVVHHLNGIKSDNRPENLVGKPKKSHDAITRLEPYKKRIRQLEIENRQLTRALENSQMILYLNEN